MCLPEGPWACRRWPASLWGARFFDASCSPHGILSLGLANGLQRAFQERLIDRLYQPSSFTFYSLFNPLFYFQSELWLLAEAGAGVRDLGEAGGGGDRGFKVF